MTAWVSGSACGLQNRTRPVQVRPPFPLSARAGRKRVSKARDQGSIPWAGAIPGSSNGRTAGSEPAGWGSKPCPGSIATVAQPVECPSHTGKGAGSIPARGTKIRLLPRGLCPPNCGNGMPLGPRDLDEPSRRRGPRGERSGALAGPAGKAAECRQPINSREMAGRTATRL